MRAHSLEHLSDRDLLCELEVRVRSSTTELVACIGEVDARKLYLPAGYSSMYAYCVEKLGLSEGSAYKRIQVARAARGFPLLLDALADGALNLTGVVLLAPHLRPENAGDLIDAARGKPCGEIEELLARRFPRTELLPMVSVPIAQLSARTVIDSTTERMESVSEQPPAPHVPFSRTSPIAKGRYAIQASIGEETHANLVYLQELLSHRIPSGNLAEVLDWVLKAAVRLAERQRFSGTTLEPAKVERSARAVVDERDQELVAGLMGLGFRRTEVDQAAAFCADMGAASPEERMIAAIKFLRPARPSSPAA